MSPATPPSSPPPAAALAALEALAEGVILQGLNGEIEWANPAAEVLLGLSLDQLQGRSSLDPRWQAIHPDGRPFPGEDHPAMRTLRTGAAERDVPMGIRLPGGGLRWLRINTRLVRDAAGARAGVVASFRDVTAELELQAALEAERDRLLAAQRLAGMGDWTHDPVAKEARLSPTLQEVLGLGEGPHPEALLMAQLASESAQRLLATSRALAPGAEAYLTLCLRADARGRERHLLTRLTRLADGRLMGTAQDVTLLQSLRLDLARAEELRALAVDGAGLGTWDFDIPRARIGVNPQWCHMLGLPVAESVPLTVWAEALHPDDRAETEGGLSRYLERPDGALLLEYRLRHQEGQWVHVFSAGRATAFGPDGQATRLVGVNLDVSPLRAAEQAVSQASVALSAVREAVALVDETGRILQANPAFRALVGREASTAGRHLIALLRGYDGLEAVAEAVAAGSRWHGALERRGDVEGRSLEIRVGAAGRPDAPRAVVLADVTAERRRERLVSLDPLTGIPNRRALERDLEAWLAAGRPFAVAFIDLDAFKPVNDRLGHAIGDAVLRQIALRLSRRLRPEDRVARFGGDEFIALLADVTRREDASQAVSRLVEACTEPISVEERTVQVGASAGIAVYPVDGEDAASLIRAADAAMFREKRQRPRPGRRTGPPGPLSSE